MKRLLNNLSLGGQSKPAGNNANAEERDTENSNNDGEKRGRRGRRKDKTNDTTNTSSQPYTTAAAPTATQILQYRYQHGVNLGSIFVLEKWLSPSMFPPTSSGSSELDALTASLQQQQRGPYNSAARWKEHWVDALPSSPAELMYLSAAVTTLRLPIGYFTLGPAFCTDTPFAAGADVYAPAWPLVKSFIARAHREHGLGTLIDLHALPGGANGEAHSGTSNGVAELWAKGTRGEALRALATRCAVYVAREWVGSAELRRAVVGLQLCNEAAWGQAAYWAWAEQTINAVNTAITTQLQQQQPAHGEENNESSVLPLYISDAWDLPLALRFAARLNASPLSQTTPVVVDTHVYYTFSAAHTRLSPQAILAKIPSSLPAPAPYTAVFVGEWSCTLSEPTWSLAAAADDPSSPSSRSALTRAFGQAQMAEFQAHSSSGSAFWTWKKRSNGDAWDFRAQVDSGAVSAPGWLGLDKVAVRAKLMGAERGREERAERAVREHVSYWTATRSGGSGGKWDGIKYGTGWAAGWADAVAFFGSRLVVSVSRAGGIAAIDNGSSHGDEEEAEEESQRQTIGADRIGALDLWVLRRLREAGMDGQEGGWEWEHGFRRGVRDFEEAVVLLPLK